MSILIKNMKTPRQGRVTLQIGADGTVYVVDKCEITAEKYEKNFEVFEVPTPHGRLIDADALTTYPNPIGKLMMYGGEYVYTQTAIDDAPTIIEAEGKYE